MAVVGVSRGESCSEVARALECATSTVASAVRRYLEGRRKGLLDRQANNGDMKVDERFLAILARMLQGMPEDVGWCRPTWTRELLALEMTRRGFLRVSEATMGRALAQLYPVLALLAPCHSQGLPDGVHRQARAVDDTQSGQGERQHSFGVEVVSEESSEEFMHLLFVDGWSTHFSSNIHDPTAEAREPANPLLACLLK